MNMLERIRQKIWIYRLLVKWRRNKLYCKMERETGERERKRREREKGEAYRERDRVKGSPRKISWTAINELNVLRRIFLNSRNDGVFVRCRRTLYKIEIEEDSEKQRLREIVYNQLKSAFMYNKGEIGGEKNR